MAFKRGAKCYPPLGSFDEATDKGRPHQSAAKVNRVANNWFVVSIVYNPDESTKGQKEMSHQRAPENRVVAKELILFFPKVASSEKGSHSGKRSKGTMMI